ADEKNAAVTVARHFVGSEFRRTCRFDTAVHPMHGYFALGFISFREGEGSVTCRRRRITEISSLTPVDVHIAHARLYVARIFEVQYPEGRLHQVTTKIAKGTGTIVPPS